MRQDGHVETAATDFDFALAVRMDLGDEIALASDVRALLDRLDLLLMAAGGPVRLLRNDQQTGHHWLRFSLTGTKSNRDAIGAVVRVTLPDGTIQTRLVNPTCSYQSQVERPVTFGLGEFETVDAVEITWPSGRRQTVTVESVDQQMDVVEPAD